MQNTPTGELDLVWANTILQFTPKNAENQAGFGRVMNKLLTFVFFII
jgi:hypothetical protein